ncbi:MAG: hypothetical protein M1828_000199 [Chrysothrix sp. TS-e1954]|nr:MAG: hypothetical protein M1828_000199 [Chrysothrix sp. TS-e1954]
MPFTLHPVTKGDVDLWCHVLQNANTEPISGRPFDPFVDAMFPGFETPRGTALFTRLLAAPLDEPKPEIRIRKVVETESGRTPGFAMWVEQKPPISNPPIREEWFGEDFSQDEGERKRAREYAQQLSTALNEKRMRQIESWEGVSIVLQSLAVLPEFQRRGVGAMLMQDGTEWADSLNARVQVDATPQAAKLYERFGLALVEAVTRPAPVVEWKEREPSFYDFRVRPAKSERDAR